jgi:hypothetical protein
MAMWFRIRLGPFGYTIRGRRRRRRQSYRDYKVARNRRNAYAARCKREQFEAKAGGRRVLKSEEQWLDGIPVYTSQVRSQLSLYADAVAKGTSSPDYAAALDRLLAAPEFLRETVGDGPTQRTREITDVLRRHALAIKGYAERWDTYLSRHDLVAKSEALALVDEISVLGDRAASLLAEMRRV